MFFEVKFYSLSLGTDDIVSNLPEPPGEVVSPGRFWLLPKRDPTHLEIIFGLLPLEQKPFAYLAGIIPEK